ncbi:MAG: MMPL family transporter [Myxococcales bacterium]|nr:MMPL family transporter [Myxococcales bacterium]
MTLTQRIFAGLADSILRRPLLVLVVAAIVVALAGSRLPSLGVSTSRYGMVSADNPDQARMLRFFERFGNPDAPVFVLSGGTADERRTVVDRMTALLEAEEPLRGRVLARIGPQEVAEVILLQRPEALAEAARALPANVPLAPLIEGGLPAWLGAIAGQIQAGLDGEAPADPKAAAQGVQGLADMAGTFDAYLAGEDVLSRMGEPPAQDGAPRGRDERGYLTTVDGQNHVISMFPRLTGDEVTDVLPIVSRLRSIRDEVLASAPDGVQARLTGLPALIVDEQAAIRRGLLVSSVTSAAAIILLCLIMLRSFRQTLIAQVPLLFGVVLTLAYVQLAYGNLNLITSSFVSVLLGLGIDFGVHMIYRFNEQRRRGDEVPAAIRGAVRFTGPAIVVGALVTAVAFITTLMTEFTAYGQLGVITAIGLAFMVATSLTVLPALLFRRAGAKIAPVAKEPPGFRALTRFVARARVPILLVAVLGGVAGALGLPRIGFNSRYFDFLPAHSDAAQALDVLEGDPLMSPVYANASAQGVEAARALSARLRALPEVAGVQTATDLLPPLDDARLHALRSGLAALTPMPDFNKLAGRNTTPEELLPPLTQVVDGLEEARFAAGQGGQPTADLDRAHKAFVALKKRIGELDADGKARLAAIEPTLGRLLLRAVGTAEQVAKRGGYVPSDLPPLFRDRFRGSDGESMAVYVIPAGSAFESETANAFYRAVSAVDPEVSGLAVNINLHETMIITGFRRAAALAAILIFLLVTVELRSLRDGVFALVPTAIGWLWMLGVMAAIGLHFNVANIVGLPLVIGIGTAFGVHLMHRCQESAREHGGVATLDDLVRSTGGAVVLSALTTIASFAALMLGEYGGMKTIGLLMVLGISSCLVASLLVLPALLAVFKRAA